MEDFEKVEIRVGQIVKAEEFPEARKPAYKLTIDFGSELGQKQSSAQLTKHYELEDLDGKRVACLTSTQPRKIGPFTSEVLTLGFPDEEGEAVLVSPDVYVPLGGRLF